MRRNFVAIAILWGCLLCIGTVSAAPLSSQQAKRLAKSFLNARGKTVSELHVAKAPYTKEQSTEDAAYHVFDAVGGGFIVVSGDDRTAPVLGYSDRGVFPDDDMPEGLKWLLQTYEEQIGHLREVSGLHEMQQSQQTASPTTSVRHG